MLKYRKSASLERLIYGELQVSHPNKSFSATWRRRNEIRAREHGVVSLTLLTFCGSVSVCSAVSIFWLTAAVADGVCLIQLVPSTVWAALCCPGGARHSGIWDILQGCHHGTLPAPSGHWCGGREV